MSFASIDEVYGNEFGIEEQQPVLRVNHRPHGPAQPGGGTTDVPSKYPGYLDHNLPPTEYKTNEDYSKTMEDVQGGDESPLPKDSAHYQAIGHGCQNYLFHVHNCPECQRQMNLGSGGLNEGFLGGGKNDADMILCVIIALVGYYLLFHRNN